MGDQSLLQRFDLPFNVASFCSDLKALWDLDVVICGLVRAYDTISYTHLPEYPVDADEERERCVSLRAVLLNKCGKTLYASCAELNLGGKFPADIVISVLVDCVKNFSDVDLDAIKEDLFFKEGDEGNYEQARRWGEFLNNIEKLESKKRRHENALDPRKIPKDKLNPAGLHELETSFWIEGQKRWILNSLSQSRLVSAPYFCSGKLMKERLPADYKKRLKLRKTSGAAEGLRFAIQEIAFRKLADDPENFSAAEIARSTPVRNLCKKFNRPLSANYIRKNFLTKRQLLKYASEVGNESLHARKR